MRTVKRVYLWNNGRYITQYDRQPLQLGPVCLCYTITTESYKVLEFQLVMSLERKIHNF
jgi:hypothetical protein